MPDTGHQKGSPDAGVKVGSGVGRGQKRTVEKPLVHRSHPTVGIGVVAGGRTGRAGRRPGEIRARTGDVVQKGDSGERALDGREVDALLDAVKLADEVAEEIGVRTVVRERVLDLIDKV